MKLLNLIKGTVSSLDRSPKVFRPNVQLYELNQRFLWFVVARFFVIVTFVILAFFKHFLLPHIAVTSAIFLYMALFLSVANFVYWMHYRRSGSIGDPLVYSRRISINVQTQIILDFFVLGYLVYRCGGIESPLVYFFLFHNVISCLFFKKLISLLHTLISLGIIYLVSLLPFFGYVTAYHFIFNQVAEKFYNNPVVYAYELAGITVSFLIVWLCVAGITDTLKIHEKWLQDKIDELIEMDKERTRYLLVTTHELKAPFSAIQSYANVLLGGYAGELSEKTREILGKIKIRCELLMKMITQMLLLANLNSIRERKEEVVKDDLDLMNVVERVAGNLRQIAAAKGVRIVWPEGVVCVISANDEQMNTLFNNVLSNAVSYCYSDTEISVEVSDAENTFLVTVTDRGIGIKKKDLEKVFLEYFRTEEAVQFNKSSTGLGLPIARQIMGLHGGRIWVESEEKVGTRVHLEFVKPKKGDTE